MAKSKLDITPKIIEEIKELAGRGLTVAEIHTYYGIQKTAWYEKIKEFPEIEDIIKQAKAKKCAIATGILWNHIKNGNVTALIFYLKTQHGWSEKLRIEEEKSDNKELDYSLKTTNPIEASKKYQKIME